jgi:hypothetical protein
VWFATVWAIWQGRNNKVFKGTVWDHNIVFELIKHHSWLWVKAAVKGFNYSFYG